MEQEYIVTLHQGIDYDQVWSDIENSTTNIDHIPDRSVKIINPRELSLRVCHYALTEQEAEQLKNDPRILDVELTPLVRDDIQVGRWSRQIANFTKTTVSTGDNINWGLIRGSSNNNPYGNGTTTLNSYDYHLDGEGVDVVISDSGLQVDHPEFTDKNGASRVKQIDWYVESGTFTPGPVNVKTKPTVIISSNSYISFTKVVNSYSVFTPATIGNALTLGAGDRSVDTIHGGSEDGGKSYRIRFNGNSDWTQTNQGTLKWEVRFLDNNWIEILVIRHDTATTGDWKLQDDTVVQLDLSTFFGQSALQGSGATPLSCVLTTNDGQTWTINNGNNGNYRAELVGGTWTLVANTATEKGIASLSVITTTHADEVIYYFNTPFDFYMFTQTTSPQSALHYRDYDGHGTHVAGITAGKNYGWAKGANVYSIKVGGLEGSGDSGNGIPITSTQDFITAWHLRKPVDPNTGLRRPTVVNMSWGYSGTYSSVTSGNYRGASWLATDTNANSSAKRLTNFGLQSTGYAVPVRQSWLDADIDQMVDAGIIVCIAAGNTPYKHESTTGADYNNYAVTNAGTKYYHRGSSPHSDRKGCFRVGSMDYVTNSLGGTTVETTKDYSTRGPVVNIWAPGTRIMSSTSNTNRFSSQPYFLNSSYRQVNISGTSMASPQVCGVVALYLQINPGATPAEVYDFITKVAPFSLGTTGSDIDYDQTFSIVGSAGQVLFTPYAVDIGMRNSAKISATFKR
jgi:subtilisin family serine protease